MPSSLTVTNPPEALVLCNGYKDKAFIETALLGQKLGRQVIITIDRLTPVSSSAGGRNFFRVEAVMDKHLDLMRPGMEGITKIEISQENLLWIWTRRLVDWLRLFVWSRLP